MYKYWVAAVAGVMVVLVVMVLGWWFGGNMGDVPSWLGAVATSTALVAAVIGARSAVGQITTLKQQVTLQDTALKLQAEQATADRADAKSRAERDDELRRVEARKQADQIDVQPLSRVTALPAVDQQRNSYQSLNVKNSSMRPIRNVRCRLTVDGATCTTGYAVELVVVTGSLVPRDVTQEAYIPLLLRSTERDFLFAVDPGERRVDYLLRFTDDAELHWELTGDMHLTQIDDRTDW